MPDTASESLPPVPVHLETDPESSHFHYGFALCWRRSVPGCVLNNPHPGAPVPDRLDSGFPVSGFLNSGFPGSDLPGSDSLSSGSPGSGSPGSGSPDPGSPDSGFPGAGFPDSGFLSSAPGGWSDYFRSALPRDIMVSRRSRSGSDTAFSRFPRLLKRPFCPWLPFSAPPRAAALFLLLWIFLKSGLLFCY